MSKASSLLVTLSHTEKWNRSLAARVIAQALEWYVDDQYPEYAELDNDEELVADIASRKLSLIAGTLADASAAEAFVWAVRTHEIQEILTSSRLPACYIQGFFQLLWGFKIDQDTDHNIYAVYNNFSSRREHLVFDNHSELKAMRPRLIDVGDAASRSGLLLTACLKLYEKRWKEAIRNWKARDQEKVKRESANVKNAIDLLTKTGRYAVTNLESSDSQTQES